MQVRILGNLGYNDVANVRLVSPEMRDAADLTLSSLPRLQAEVNNLPDGLLQRLLTMRGYGEGWAPGDAVLARWYLAQGNWEALGDLWG
jgi:hypothetical protein